MDRLNQIVRDTFAFLYRSECNYYLSFMNQIAGQVVADVLDKGRPEDITDEEWQVMTDPSEVHSGDTVAKMPQADGDNFLHIDLVKLSPYFMHLKSPLIDTSRLRPLVLWGCWLFAALPKASHYIRGIYASKRTDLGDGQAVPEAVANPSH